MFDIGFSELVLIAVIALLVLGPERLPTAARTAGRWVGRARRLLNQLNQEVDKQIKLDELREKLRQEGDHLSAEQVQKTVDEALQEARSFKHLVSQEIAEPAVDRPQRAEPAKPAVSSEPAQPSEPLQPSDPGQPESEPRPAEHRIDPSSPAYRNSHSDTSESR